MQHVGFDAAPLKVAERRLQGDAAGVPPRSIVPRCLPPADPAVASVRAALAGIPWNTPPPAGGWPPETLDALRRVEAPLTAAATRRPEVFLDGLQILRRLRAGEGPAPADAAGLRPLERALWRLLPTASARPDRAPEAAPPLTEAYLKALQDEEAKP